MRAARLLPLIAVMLAGCELSETGPGPSGGATPAAGTTDGAAVAEPALPAEDPAAEAVEPEQPETETTAPAPVPASVPHVYMAVQHGAGTAVSIVFAIDDARDNTPSDDPAMRLTPESGRCNPQEMAYFNFPAEYAGKPVFSEVQAAEGVTADLLPTFMAIEVTDEIIRLGLAETPQQTHAQNVCTRKLWEQLIQRDRQQVLAPGQ